MSSHHTKKASQSQSAPLTVSGKYPIWKERGETLAVLLDRFRRSRDLGPEVKLTYAGRLDPMAEGLVLVLAGESRFGKDALLGLSKTYEVQILLGISTDTLDALGIITATALGDIDTGLIQKAVAKMHSITTLPYPHYSSVPVAGKPLFVHAREGRGVVIPHKIVYIKAVEILSIKKEFIAILAKDAVADIGKVYGDFRQEEIIKSWKTLLADTREGILATIRVDASSGTYMRSLAEWLGNELGIPAIAYKIIRTKLGTYKK